VSWLRLSRCEVRLRALRRHPGRGLAHPAQLKVGNRQCFEEDEVLQSAVLRWIEIIGEASRWLTDQFRHEHSEVPWREIFGMRNRVTHGYFDIDLDVVWNTVMNDLAALEDAIVGWLPPSDNR
jgi:uncharacterized protein with HEPN domain